MKAFLLTTVMVLVCNQSLASTSKEWKPKYEKKKLTAKEVVSTEKKSTTLDKTIKLEKKAEVPEAIKNHKLYPMYLKEYKAKTALNDLKQKTLELKQDAVPLLTYVMKTDEFPDNNRWVATFMLGRIMGKKSANFISKFVSHPNFMMRLASLKALLALDQQQFKGIYARLLKDKAMIVRLQALENIREMKLKELAPYVWAMLYDKMNYSVTEGSLKRGSIIKTIIKTMGDLEFKDAKKPMLTMIQKSKYSDIHEELDYSLSKISDKPSPKGDLKIKQHYWSRLAVTEKTI